MGSGLSLRAASSERSRAADAVADVASQLDPDAGCYFAFVPDRYDLEETAASLVRWGGSRIAACTSAGGIGPGGFTRDGLVAVSLSGPGVRSVTLPVAPLSDLPSAWAQSSNLVAAAIEGTGGAPAFAVLLVDGLSMREEEVTEGLRSWLGRDIPLVGGSAADDLRFEETRVLLNGQFVANAATLTVVTAPVPFRAFRIQHHVAGDTVLVVTDADPAGRVIHTLNGRSAAQEYADALGVEPGDLTLEVFTRNPLILRTSGGEWVRGVASARPDGSLVCYSAAARGTVLRLGTTGNAVGAIRAACDDLRDDLGELSGALVFDCVMHRLEFEERGIDEEVGTLLRSIGAAGFSTYGEQFGGIHVNQTMVGVAFGG